MRIKTFVLTGLGYSFLGLGVVGIFLPIWPTTPFVLASFACFSSSPHLRRKIMRISFFREYIEHYSSKTGLSKKTILVSIIWLWSMLIISMIMLQTVWLSILLVCIGISVTLHIVWVGNVRKNQKIL